LAQSDNPARKFEWGNLITLRDNIDDDDLYEAVHEFRKRHYSSHRMTLAVQVV
jgi:nardilysin